MPDSTSSTEPHGTRPVDSGDRSSERDQWIGRHLGKYQLVRQLGRGGMGVVYEAWDTLLNRQVAIKLKSKSVGDAAQDVERFLRESRALARLQHPHVVAAYEADIVEEQYLIALELMSGGSLQASLQQGPLPWREATEVIAQACSGLEAAHQAGIIHRDIKPSNLLRSSDGTVKLSDFGLARPHEPSGTTLTGSGSVLGTPQYMSPEQCRSERADERSDLYSLGATYFALLVGRPPYGGAAPLLVMNAHLLDPVPDPRDVDETIPAACSAIIQRAMAKDPDDRISSATEMLAALQTLLSDARMPTTAVDSNAKRLRRDDSQTDESAHPGAMTDLSWGRSTQKSEPRSGLDATTAVLQRAGSTNVRRQRRAVAWLLASVVGGLLVVPFLNRLIERPDSNSSSTQTNETAPVAVPIVSGKADDDAMPEPAPIEPQQPIAAPLKRRLALPVAELPPDAFRLPDMKINQAAQEDRREVWECVIPGLAHVAAANSGAFLVGLSRVDAPQVGLQSRVDVWNPAGEKLLSTIVPGRPTSLAVSADSRRVAIGSETVRGVVVFDSTTWERIPLTDLADDAVMSVALSDDARWLAYGTSRISQAQ